MPTLISQHQVSVEWTDLDLWDQIKVRPSSRVRSSGVHLSGIIKAVLQGMGKLDREDLTDEMPLRMAIGMAWENWVVGLMPKPPEFRWQPGEWEKDGVYGTPDGMSQVDKRLMVEEFKATWKSERTHGEVEEHSILEEKIWIWQLMANCHAKKVVYARLHVLWVNGDYRPPSPKYMRYVVKFEKKELAEFWELVVLRNRQLAVREQH